MLILKQTQLITVDIFYFMPDHPSLVQEFMWQTEDVAPELKRVHRFLNHWKNNIDAVIQEIILCGANYNTSRSFRSIDEVFRLN